MLSEAHAKTIQKTAKKYDQIYTQYLFGGLHYGYFLVSVEQKANIRAGGKTIHVSFKYLSRSLSPYL